MPAAAATVVHAGAALVPDGMAGPVEVTVVDGRIDAVVACPDPGDASLLAPGFVDLQVNGVDDVDVTAAAGADWDRLDSLLAATGVTAWLPTLVSRPLDRYAGALARIAGAAARTGPRPAVLGGHLEGPFLGGRPGAHDRRALVPVERGWLAELPPVVRLVTLAPELDGALEAVRDLTDRGVTVSLGHSAADVARTTAAIDAGAAMVTHLFNAMAPLHQREPGLGGAALADDRVVAGLIADLVHVHPALIRTAFRAKGAARIALVTDAVAWRSERLAGREIDLVDGAPRLTDGTLAGSALTMDGAVRNVVSAGVPLDQALRAASTTPADVLGERARGRIAPGARADLVLLGRDELDVRRTIIAGETVWER